MEPQRAARLGPRLAYFRDGGAHVIERRTQRTIKALARVGEVDAAGRAAYQGHAEACLKPAHGLTDCRMGDAEAISGSPKPLRFRNGDERRPAIEFFSHW